MSGGGPRRVERRDDASRQRPDQGVRPYARYVSRDSRERSREFQHERSQELQRERSGELERPKRVVYQDARSRTPGRRPLLTSRRYGTDAEGHQIVREQALDADHPFEFYDIWDRNDNCRKRVVEDRYFPLPPKQAEDVIEEQMWGITSVMPYVYADFEGSKARRNFGNYRRFWDNQAAGKAFFSARKYRREEVQTLIEDVASHLYQYQGQVLNGTPQKSWNLLGYIKSLNDARSSQDASAGNRSSDVVEDKVHKEYTRMLNDIYPKPASRWRSLAAVVGEINIDAKLVESGDLAAGDAFSVSSLIHDFESRNLVEGFDIHPPLDLLAAADAGADDAGGGDQGATFAIDDANAEQRDSEKEGAAYENGRMDALIDLERLRRRYNCTYEELMASYGLESGGPRSWLPVELDASEDAEDERDMKSHEAMVKTISRKTDIIIPDDQDYVMMAEPTSTPDRPRCRPACLSA